MRWNYHTKSLILGYNMTANIHMKSQAWKIQYVMQSINQQDFKNEKNQIILQWGKETRTFYGHHIWHTMNIDLLNPGVHCAWVKKDTSMTKRIVSKE